MINEELHAKMQAEAEERRQKTATALETYNELLACQACVLREGCRSPVPWSGPPVSSVLFIGEKPGKGEDASLRPWSGPAGREFDGYLARNAGLSRSQVRVTNVVRCYTGSDARITADVTEACHEWTVREVKESECGVIVPMGARAIKTILADGLATVESTRGYPEWLQNAEHLGGWSGWVFPMANPAFGMRAGGAEMQKIANDFDRFRRWMGGGSLEVVDEFAGKEAYKAINDDDWEMWEWFTTEMFSQEVISADTEWTPDGKLWCCTISWEPGEAWLLTPEQVCDIGEMWRFAPLENTSNPRVCLHNSPADLPVLAEAGWVLDGSEIEDTMVMSYVLQDLPQGLKDLAKLLCGIEMKDYEDTVKPAQEQLTEEYIRKIIAADFPKPAKGNSISSMAKAAITKFEKGTAGLEKCWPNWTRAGRVAEVEAELGPYPVASMASIPFEQALEYSCRDADATERVRRELKRRLGVGLDNE